jgi:hypothetical protein
MLQVNLIVRNVQITGHHTNVDYFVGPEDMQIPTVPHRADTVANQSGRVNLQSHSQKPHYYCFICKHSDYGCCAVASQICSQRFQRSLSRVPFSKMFDHDPQLSKTFINNQNIPVSYPVPRTRLFPDPIQSVQELSR